MAQKGDEKPHHQPKLVDDFKYPGYDEWREEVEKLLKGKPYDKIMLTDTYEGITLDPVYNPSDVGNIPFVNSMPGQAPFVRGTKASGYLGEAWEIAQESTIALPEEFNRTVLNDLSKGQTAAYLVLDQASATGKDPGDSEAGRVGMTGTSISTLNDLEMALADIDLENTTLYIRVFTSGLAIAGMLANVCEIRNINIKKIRGAIEFDPVAQLISSGTLPASLDDIYDEMHALLNWSIDNAPGIQIIGVFGHFWGDSGSNIVQEISFGMATGLNYIKEMLNRDLSVNDIAPRMRFSFSIGSNFFMEIAKFRAVKMLWFNIIKALGGNEEAQKIHIHARSSSSNKTILDPYVNLLRTTTESFSGILGGIESLHVSTFDAPLGNEDDFSRRIARNQQLVLKEEANLEKLIDPAGGSWYMEKMTAEISEKAWALFQQVEAKGGIVQALMEGFPQSEIEKTVLARLENVNKRKDVVVGSNLYANINEQKYNSRLPDPQSIYKTRCEKVSSAIEKDPLIDLKSLLPGTIEAMKKASIGQYYQALRKPSAKIRIEALKPFNRTGHIARLREKMSQYKEATGSAASVYLANMGALKNYKARADFSRGFFEVGGFHVIYPPGADSPEAAAQGALDSAAKIVVLCSTDNEYPDIVGPFVKSVKKDNPDTYVILAGYPQEHVQEFRASGIDEFIHVRADVFEILQNAMKKAGVM